MGDAGVSEAVQGYMNSVGTKSASSKDKMAASECSSRCSMGKVTLTTIKQGVLVVVTQCSRHTSGS